MLGRVLPPVLTIFSHLEPTGNQNLVQLCNESDQSKHDLDLEHVQKLQQLDEDENVAFVLQRCYDAKEIIIPEDENTTISDLSSIATYFGRQVEESSPFLLS